LVSYECGEEILCLWLHVGDDPFVPATIALCSFIMEDNEEDACIGQI